MLSGASVSNWGSSNGSPPASPRRQMPGAMHVNYVPVASWSSYGEFLAFACVLVLIPGPDFAVVAKNTLMAGRRRGWWASLGICTSNAVQGTAAAAGLGALIVRSQPVFEAIKWAGVCYLAFLGFQAVRSAIRGRYD